MSAGGTSVRAIAAGTLEGLVDEDDGTITAVPQDADDEVLVTHWLTTDTWIDAKEAR
jgi:hypothetical protein